MFISIAYFFQIILLQSVENPTSYQAEKINKLFNYFNIAAACFEFIIDVHALFFCKLLMA